MTGETVLVLVMAESGVRVVNGTSGWSVKGDGVGVTY